MSWPQVELIYGDIKLPETILNWPGKEKERRALKDFLTLKATRSKDFKVSWDPGSHTKLPELCFDFPLVQLPLINFLDGEAERISSGSDLCLPQLNSV